jgi:hypothetical protein
VTGIPARPGETGTHRDILENMDFREKKLCHQIHPRKLATDIGVTPLSLYFVWEHRVLPALLVGFVPPLRLFPVLIRAMPNKLGAPECARRSSRRDRPGRARRRVDRVVVSLRPVALCHGGIHKITS